MNDNRVRKLAFAGVFAALACVVTLVIQIPMPGASGYINIGDAIVLLCAWILGGPVGAVAAATGPALADIISGYAFYAPGTLIIKFLMAAAAYGIYKGLLGKSRTGGMVIGAIVAEAIMLGGYYVYDAFVLGLGYEAAALSALRGLIQGGASMALGLGIMVALQKAGVARKVLRF